MRVRSSSGVMSTSSIWSASDSALSGTVSRWRTPVIRQTTSTRLSRCWTFRVVQDVDPRLEQFLHVLPALGMARTRRRGMGVFVDQQQRRSARQRGVEVELHQRAAPMLHRRTGQDFQTVKQRLGLASAVGLHEADDDVLALGVAAGGCGQHLVGLAYARGHAEVDPQPPAALALGVGQAGRRGPGERDRLEAAWSRRGSLAGFRTRASGDRGAMVGPAGLEPATRPL